MDVIPNVVQQCTMMGLCRWLLMSVRVDEAQVDVLLLSIEYVALSASGAVSSKSGEDKTSAYLVKTRRLA